MHWSGATDSDTESSRQHYKLARFMPNIFIGMWILLIVLDAGVFLRGKPVWEVLESIFFGSFLIMGSMVWGLRYLALRYVSIVKITPAGLEVTRGASVTLHPWATIGELQTVPFVQPALWSVKFRDGSPTAAFFILGSSSMFFGMVKAKSVLVDEIMRLAAAAGAH